MQLAYIEGNKLIELANETFGFNGWSHSVTQQSIGQTALGTHWHSLHVQYVSNYDSIAYFTFNFNLTEVHLRL